jgi:hypothetical protein
MYTVTDKRGVKEFAYTSYLNFTNANVPDGWNVEKAIDFYCIFCDAKRSMKLGQTNNIMVHFKEAHKNKTSEKNQALLDNFSKWLDAFEENTVAPVNKSYIDQETMRIVNYFISCDSAIVDFDKEAFRILLSDYKRPITNSKTFKTVILEEVFMKFRKEIDFLLSTALSICIISDIWTSKNMLDFMGLAVNVIFRDFTKKTFVIGLDLMPGSHNAENIKQAIERITNFYSFNKRIANGIYLRIRLCLKSFFIIESCLKIKVSLLMKAVHM